MEQEINCNLCNHYVKVNDFDKHFKKCSSIKYMQTKLKKLYNQDVKYSDLYNLSEIEFNKKYFWLLNRVYENTTNPRERRLLENILYGADYSLKDIL